MRNSLANPGECTARGPPPTYCPFCMENRKGRSAHKGHRYLSLSPYFNNHLERTIMKRSSPSQAPTKGKWVCPDTAFAKSYPNLAQGMCDPWWDDGKPRELWTLTVRFEEGVVHVGLSDKDAGQGSYTTAASYSEALSLIEKALAEGSLSWRKWKRK